ncbi:NTP transferase domain-containing protein [bacterium]|nr:NTP transferase domain-containing protein [bacterium]
MNRNAIILAAGTSSRFVPLSYERPKGLLKVKGEILIERQILQLKEAGIDDITIVVGYKAEMFDYLKAKFGVDLVFNDDFSRYNNTSSLVRVIDRLGNTFICSSDNYFPENVFADKPRQSYYSAKYAMGKTTEYCLSTDDNDFIDIVTVGGNDSWYMIGHVYFSETFSKAFGELLCREYEKECTRYGYWEDVYISHLHELPRMKIRRFRDHDIQEFDSLDELRQFDPTYITDSNSVILSEIANRLNCKESELYGFEKIKSSVDAEAFSFIKSGERFTYLVGTKELIRP